MAASSLKKSRGGWKRETGENGITRKDLQNRLVSIYGKFWFIGLGGSTELTYATQTNHLHCDYQNHECLGNHARWLLVLFLVKSWKYHCTVKIWKIKMERVGGMAGLNLSLGTVPCSSGSSFFFCFASNTTWQHRHKMYKHLSPPILQTNIH